MSAGRLAGRSAVLTGAASGIGEATARLFVAEGAKVVVADLQTRRGEALARELGPNARFRRADVTVEADVAALVDLAVSSHGRLDCMFNNAGIVGAVGAIDAIDVDAFDATVAVHLRGAFLGMKHAARVMKPRGSGVILGSASVAALQGGLGPHPYAACKAALVGLTRNVAAELAPHGIRVNAIAPGNTATPMVAELISGDPDDVERAAADLARISPLRGRAGLASDIAHAALWLASDDAGYVSGHVLTVDGGLTSGSGAPTPPQFFREAAMIRERGRRDS